MLLEYFVTSRVRRDLLRALWVDLACGSVSQLARLANASFAGTHRELDAMRAAGLAVCERAGNRLVYRANTHAPRAGLLRRLLEGMTQEHATTPDERSDEELRGWLREAGAPIGAARVKGPAPPLEEMLASALTLAHRDAAVARVLPLVFWLRRRQVDHERLARAATRRNERQALGCFLELAGQLGGDTRLVRAAKPLRDRRRTRPQPFFTKSRGPMARKAARRNTPAVARRWGYLMNVGLDSFASAFAKHRGSKTA